MKANTKPIVMPVFEVQANRWQDDYFVTGDGAFSKVGMAEDK